MKSKNAIGQMELSPFEQRVMETLCEGKTNQFIADETGQTLRAIENTISRTAKALGVKGDSETNLRVTMALAYRLHYGDKALEGKVAV